MTAASQLAELFTTYRSQGTASARASEMFQHAFNLSPVPTVIIDPSDKIVAANRAFLTVVKASDFGIQGLHVLDFIDPDCVECVATMKQLTERRGVAVSAASVLLSNDGQRLQATAVACRLPTGNFAFYFST